MKKIMSIKEIELSELHTIVNIHSKAFPNHFLTKLGQHFLMQYYCDILKNNYGTLLGVYENNIMIGFCAATTISRNFNKKIVLQSPFAYMYIGLILCIRKPLYLYRLISNLSKNKKKSNDIGEYAELLSIAIDPEFQHSGSGGLLLHGLEALYLEKKCELISLTTDFDDNEPVINFYYKMGYTLMYEFTTYPNRKMIRLIKKI